MSLIGSVPRRCVNLPPGSLKTLVQCILGKAVQHGPAIKEFHLKFSGWLGVSHVFGTASGRSAFQLALEASPNKVILLSKCRLLGMRWQSGNSFMLAGRNASSPMF